jgi:hypothetical protein
MPRKAIIDPTKTSRPVTTDRQRAYLGQQSVGFVQAVLAPAAPNAALRNAFKRYRQQIDSVS